MFSRFGLLHNYQAGQVWLGLEKVLERRVAKALQII